MEDIYINLKEQGDYFVWKWLKKEHKKDLISVEDLIADIEQLISDVEHYQEQLHDLQRDLEDNYVPRQMSDYTGDARDDRL